MLQIYKYMRSGMADRKSGSTSLLGAAMHFHFVAVIIRIKKESEITCPDQFIINVATHSFSIPDLFAAGSKVIFSVFSCWEGFLGGQCKSTCVPSGMQLSPHYIPPEVFPHKCGDMSDTKGTNKSR